ncbi:alpha/beta hydrolase [Nocardiopsis ansamitocini]|uniref:Esterase n=1 Tax=Nocardiopsis ansamitocini TaxID=1670832 RepID=A0A9W6UI67_9ACTN|nr:alpha/beta hydrolase-fold protein [Nocardiopsis ansamitocini]GLU47402.1 hypothetical protein Nans01_17530 [Nocardiopsis ansamitocini]
MSRKFSVKTAAIAASSLAVMVACSVAVLPSAAGDTEDAASGFPWAGSDRALSQLVGYEGLHPRPGSVAVCDSGSSDEILTVPDDTAPGGQREIWVRRPPGPDTADRPVLYFLHGSTGTPDWLWDNDLGPLMDKAMCRAGVEFVLAAPHGQEVGNRDTEWGDAVDGSYSIESFVTGAAIDAVEGDQQRPRALRAIGGVSMGGYGAAALSLRHPQKYAQAISWAGYFKVDDPSGTFGDTPDEHAPDQLLDTPGAHDIRFMLIEGTEDHTPLQTGSIHGEAQRFSGLLTRHGIEHETLLTPGGHDMAAWGPTFPDAVEFLVQEWVQPFELPEPPPTD